MLRVFFASWCTYRPLLHLLLWNFWWLRGGSTAKFLINPLEESAELSLFLIGLLVDRWKISGCNWAITNKWAFRVVRLQQRLFKRFLRVVTVNVQLFVALKCVGSSWATYVLTVPTAALSDQFLYLFLTNWICILPSICHSILCRVGARQEAIRVFTFFVKFYFFKLNFFVWLFDHAFVIFLKKIDNCIIIALLMTLAFFSEISLRGELHVIDL